MSSTRKGILWRTGQGMHPPRSRIGFCPSFFLSDIGAVLEGCSATASSFKFAQGKGCALGGNDRLFTGSMKVDDKVGCGGCHLWYHLFHNVMHSLIITPIHLACWHIVERSICTYHPVAAGWYHSTFLRFLCAIRIDFITQCVINSEKRHLQNDIWFSSLLPSSRPSRLGQI